MNLQASRIANWLREQPPQAKVTLAVLADLALLCPLLVVSYMLRLSALQLPPPDRYSSYIVAPLMSVLAAYVLGVYSTVARNYSATVERKVAVSQSIAVIAWAMWLFLFGTVGFARSVLFIYGVLAVAGMILLRRAAALFFTIAAPRARRTETTSVLIYGATREGMTLVEDMRRRGQMRPVAFLDTDYTLIGRTVHGLRVFSTENLPMLISRYSPKEVIIAEAGLTRAGRRTLVDAFMAEGLTVRIAPGLEDIIGGQVTIGDLRPINVEDLLGRDPVPPNDKLMTRAVTGFSVMVTGAGGSIGSELVKQALPFLPKRLVLVENNEFALYEVHRTVMARLNRSGEKVDVVPVLADVKDRAIISDIMRKHEVDVVFHAAAYKHVNMVQRNPHAGMLNNVEGTRAAALAAIEAGVTRFVLISTDKAVRPTSVMGASKRVAEMVIQALAAEKHHKTTFAMVRFGNVLGSTGSVVPLFREQIASGGPVTVTDPDVTRYFMLVPEAAQLVIQASAMATGGDVFVLDMGEPIKIADLASTMIELAGFSQKTEDNPEGDIEIVFSGLKDGEKLYEELEIGSNLTPTENPRIMRAEEGFIASAKLNKKVEALIKLDDERAMSEAVVALAHEAVTPGEGVSRSVR